MKFVLLSFLVFGTAAVSGAAVLFSDPIHATAQSRYWKLLLHWGKPLIGFEKSESSGPDFFLSPQGATDPEAELKADVDAFSDPNHVGIGPIKQHPQCAFPERFRFLKGALNLKVKEVPCPDFEKWKAGFNPKSVTMIYAAPFFGSPASMFGHTFLRIDSKKKSDLLDYGISYEADTGKNPGPDYVVRGLLGLYHGLFLQQSYYLKINNYINMESRDLWEYELDLNSEQIDRMLNHIWEMGITYFNYYFFNKNCSYEILSLLEVANPKWDLRSQFRTMTIPSDTIRALVDVGAVRKRHLRPAITKILQAQLDSMSSKDQEDFYRIRDNYDLLDGHESVATLDALLDWDKFKTMKSLKAVYDPDENINKHLLLARAKAGAKNPFYNRDIAGEIASQSVPPEQGHGSTKISIFGGEENNYGLIGFEFRPVFQDLLDPDEGYLPHSSLVIARTRASFIDGVARLDDFTFAEVIDVMALTRFRPQISWRIGGGLFHPEDVGCLNCLGIGGAGGGGLGFQLSTTPDILLYGFLKPLVQISNGFAASYNGAYRFGGSFETGALMKFSSQLKSQIVFEPFYASGFAGDPLHQWEKLSAGLSYAFLPFEVRGTFDSFFIPNLSYSRFVLSFGHYY